MSSSKKTPAADRHHGGPGSSHQREDRPDPTEHGGSKHGESTGGKTGGKEKAAKGSANKS